MELISREKLKETIEPMVGMFDDEGDFYWSRESILRVIDNAPTIEERKEGEWVRITQDPGLRPHQYMCSECHRIIEYDSSGIPDLLERRYPYCQCGARMKVSKR